MILEYGGDGFLKLDNGAVLRPEVMAFPPCRCPHHRATTEPVTSNGELSVKLSEVNRRSRNRET
jgi:hypothetical protein